MSEPPEQSASGRPEPGQQVPGQQAPEPRATPPQWETTEFPAFALHPDAGPEYGTSATPWNPFDEPRPGYDPHGYDQQPAYGAEPVYGAQPGYDQQGYPVYPVYAGQAWAGGTPAPAPAAAPTRTRRIVVGVLAAVVVAALVAGGLLLFAGSDGSGKGNADDTAGRTIVLPSSAAGFTKLSGFDTDALKQQLGAALQSSGASANGSVQNAQIGVYSRNSSPIPGIIFVALALKDVPRLDDQVDQLGVDAAVLKFVQGASQTAGGSTPKSFSAGTLGGAMYCATGTISVESVVNCGWGDRSYFALTIVVDPSSTADAAATTRTFRAAAER